MQKTSKKQIKWNSSPELTAKIKKRLEFQPTQFKNRHCVVIFGRLRRSVHLWVHKNQKGTWIQTKADSLCLVVKKRSTKTIKQKKRADRRIPGRRIYKRPLTNWCWSRPALTTGHYVGCTPRTQTNKKHNNEATCPTRNLSPQVLMSPLTTCEIKVERVTESPKWKGDKKERAISQNRTKTSCLFGAESHLHALCVRMAAVSALRKQVSAWMTSQDGNQ
jgi:hypothetical protein